MAGNEEMDIVLPRIINFENNLIFCCDVQIDAVRQVAAGSLEPTSSMFFMSLVVMLFGGLVS